MFPEHSVEDNLLIAAKSGPDGRETGPCRASGKHSRCSKDSGRAWRGRLSGGEQQLLVIARALMCNPLVVLLDEPSEGLVPIVVATIGKVPRELGGGGGATLLLAEQNMHFCLRIAEEAVVIDKGKVVHRQDTAGLAGNEDIRRRYLAM
ncbi:ATP-binding cassette domain-containing protein [Bradyrhizobium sp. ARR65]|uniref:ATP-binding cassette domain-containing protein n=1 Tax=Bradyrhizobium sp. ARR65 TaxID=1040989 RepID=UPI000A065E84|nr:ATP-binding cassette domain-containing protein [Bradyrhizobium sp. ARR65]